MPRVAERRVAHTSVANSHSEDETNSMSLLSTIDSTITDTTTTTCVYRKLGRRRQITSSDVTTTVISGGSVDDSNQNQGPSRATSTCSLSPVPKRGSEKRPCDRKSGKFYFSDGDVGSSVSSTSKATSDESRRKRFFKKRGKKASNCDDSDSEGSILKKFCSWRRCQRRKKPGTDSEGDTYTMSRAEKDQRRFEAVRERLRAWGERSTFHGVDVLMETPADWRRVFVFVLLCIMTALCWICCGKMVLGFLNMSVTTVIDRDMKEFRFPAITVCPDSPFTMAQLEAEGGAFQEYKKLASLWMKESPNTSTLDPQKWPQYEGQWRQRSKYSFFRTYIKTSSLHVPWERYFVACQYNGLSCPELPVNGVSVELVGMGGGDNREADAGKNGVYVGNSHWTLDPGRIYGYKDVRGNITERLKAATSIANQTIWPKESPVRIVTTAKYQCFQIRMKMTSVKRSGSRAGLHLILKRPYQQEQTHPALLYADADASIYQGWDDHQGAANSEDAVVATEMDGFQVLLHDVAENDQPVLSAADVASIGDAHSVVRTSVRFGQHLVVTVNQFILDRLDTYFRPCKKNIHPIFYLDVEIFVKEQKRRAISVEYTRRNCVAALRQSVMQRRCGCLSESSMVPLYLVNHLATQGFCHDDGRDNISAAVACHDDVMRMSDEEILEASIPKRWYRVVLVKLKPHTRHFWLCPQPCVERVNEISHQQVLALEEGLPRELLERISSPNGTNTSTKASVSSKASGGLAKTDYLVISVAAENSRVAIHSEGESASFFNLLAALGGIFGLFLGLSGVTMFEVLESYCILLSQGFGTFRHAAKVGVSFGKKIFAREKSPEFDDDEGGVTMAKSPPPPPALKEPEICTDWDAAVRKATEEIQEYLSRRDVGDQRPDLVLPAYRCVKNAEGKWDCNFVGSSAPGSCLYPVNSRPLPTAAGRASAVITALPSVSSSPSSKACPRP
ncbi:hypothetical protein EGR_04584 [Echinococcus granulosus]|uniref:Uncharacterized protein n=2 Tax=Echinococcus granulosus TaxID=6210 RepID=W6UGD9_ECHGR|nr:hypothetical protein EGR_04584 [Echinococcus granulosus]EUB60565.1 hypothetical protein EGR_04584 [Echinococcus granulosus]